MIIAQDMIIFSDFSSIHHVLETGREDVEEHWMSVSLSPKAPWGTEATVGCILDQSASWALWSSAAVFIEEGCELGTHLFQSQLCCRGYSVKRLGS